MTKRKIIKNCKIYSMDKNNSEYSAMVFDDDKIICLGDEETIKTYERDAEEIIDLNNNIVLPGFCEAHVHAPGLAYDILFNINLYPALSQEETINLIKEHIEKNPEKEIYYGRGFNVNLFEGEEGVIGPRKERLDEICSTKPIIISDFGGNCMWLNSAALAKYDIYPGKKCPPGGEIQLDSKTGELWGIIRNEARSFVPYQEFSVDENYKAMKHFQKTMLKYGYTSVFALRPPGTVEPRTTLFEAFKVLEDRNELHLRIHGARDMDATDDVDEQIEEMLEIKKNINSTMMELTTAKFFLDGVVEGLDGYLLEPYSEATGKGKSFTGKLFWDKEKLAYAFEKVMKAGFQIHCHTIGDGAVHDALDALEEALKNVPKGDYRNTLTHLQLVSEEDKKRMADLNVIATVQPYWHFKSPVMYPLEEKLLDNRAEKEYPLNSLVENGIKIVSSSDYPVTAEPNPFHAIETSVTRNLSNANNFKVEDIKNMDDEKYLLNKSERISLTEAIKSFTVNSAFYRFTEEKLGSLENGKLADFIVIDRDPYKLNAIDIEKINVVNTFLNGKEVYKK